MDTLAFLQRILPDAGTRYCAVTWTTKGSVHNHTFYPRLSALAEYLDHASARSHSEILNVFVTTASLTGNKRAIGSCELKRCYYIDMDAGPDKPYESTQAALDALKTAVRSGGLPLPTLIGCSGNGVHAYWCLDEPVPPVVWKPVMEALINACAGADLQIDQPISRDLVRILRMPGSMNNKHDRPATLSKLLFDAGPTYTNEGFATTLGTLAPVEVPLVDNSDLSAGLITKLEPLPAKPMLTHCGVFAHHMETGGADAPSGAWFQIINTLSFTKDGEDYIHPISDQHATYEPRVVDKRFAYAKQQQANGVKPTSCNTFAAGHPEICAVCPHRSTINSPIALTARLLSGPELPRGYFQNASGVFLKVRAKSDEDPKNRFVMPYNFVSITLTRDPEQGQTIHYRIHPISRPDDVSDVRHLTKHILTDGAKITEDLSKGDVVLDTEQLKLYRNFIVAWAQKLQQASTPAQTISKYGWTADHTGFAFGNFMARADGRLEKAVVRVDDRMAAVYTPTGDLDPWKQCCDFVVAQGRQELAALIASAFAAPLLIFTDISGTLLSLYSKESGTGKSTSMKIAQGVWGSPQEGINALNDTPNSVAKRMGVLNNLPVYWDELRGGDNATNFVHLVFQLGQGKEKGRLRSDAKLQATGTWNTLIAVATNEPVVDHVGEIVHGSDAGLARVFELTCSPMPVLSSQTFAAAQRMFSGLAKNYGHAGRVYAQYLVTNHDKVRKLLDRNIESLMAKVQMLPSERFRLHTLATLVTGAQLANDAKLTHFDIRALMIYLIREFLRMRGHTAAEVKGDSAAAHVKEFMAAHADSRVILDCTKTRPNAREMPKRMPLCYQVTVNPTDVTLSIKRDLFTRWAKDKFHMLKTNIGKDMTNAGFAENSVNIGTGTGIATGSFPCFTLMQPKGSILDPYSLLEHYI